MESENICQKKDSLKNFNLIYINNFERLRVPQLIEGKFIKKIPEKQTNNFLFFKRKVDNEEIPAEILNVLKTGEAYAFEGIIYRKTIDAENGEVFYECFEDETERVKQILLVPEIRRTLDSLESAIRKPALTRDFLSLPGFKHVETELGEVSLSIEDDMACEKNHPLEKNTRSCKIVLTTLKDSFVITLELGILTYSVYRKN